MSPLPETKELTGEAARKVLFLIERKRFQEAGQLLGEVLRETPDDLGLRYAGALLEFEQGQPERAEEEAQKLLLRYPKNEAVRYLLFRIALEQDNEEKALEQINGLCGDYPGHAGYAASRAALFLLAERFEEAREEAERALQLDPEAKAAQEIHAHSSLAIAETDGIDRQLAMRLQADPEAMSIRYLLLAALNARGEYLEGLKVAQGMLRENPQDKELLAIVKEFRLLAQPVPWLFRPLHMLEQRGISRSIIIGVGIVVVLKSALHGYLPSFVALPLLIYLAAASLYPLVLRRWLG